MRHAIVHIALPLILIYITCAVDAAIVRGFSTVVARGVNGNASIYIPAASSTFGPEPLRSGDSGVLVHLESDGCRLTPLLSEVHDLERSKVFQNYVGLFIVVMPRGNCSFDQKVYNAQLVGAIAAVISDKPSSDSRESYAATDPDNDADDGYSGEGVEDLPGDHYYADFDGEDLTQPPTNPAAFDGLLRMASSRYGPHIFIPSVFIAHSHSLRLREMFDASCARGLPVVGSIVNLSSTSTRDGARDDGGLAHDLAVVMLFTFVMASGFGLLNAVYLVYHHLRVRRAAGERRKQLRAQFVSPEELKLIPVVEITGGSATGTSSNNLTTCAVCLDDLSISQKARVLPCSHQFHMECVDDWLLSRHKSCPTCRQVVIVSGKLNVPEPVVKSTSLATPGGRHSKRGSNVQLDMTSVVDGAKSDPLNSWRTNATAPISSSAPRRTASSNGRHVTEEKSRLLADGDDAKDDDDDNELDNGIRQSAQLVAYPDDGESDDTAPAQNMQTPPMATDARPTVIMAHKCSYHCHLYES